MDRDPNAVWSLHVYPCSYAVCITLTHSTRRPSAPASQRVYTLLESHHLPTTADRTELLAVVSECLERAGLVPPGRVPSPSASGSPRGGGVGAHRSEE